MKCLAYQDCLKTNKAGHNTALLGMKNRIEVFAGIHF